MRLKKLLFLLASPVAVFSGAVLGFLIGWGFGLATTPVLDRTVSVALGIYGAWLGGLGGGGLVAWWLVRQWQWLFTSRKPKGAH